MKNLPRTALSLCAICVLAGTSTFAAAQSATESITVTGVRQAYRGDFARLDTPQADLTLDAQLLRATGANDLSRALDLSASVARQNNFGGLWNAFALRGFVGDENLPSNVLVNGFNAGRGFGGPRDLSGIEAVEVLKGPRAALFGRGEPGGTVNLLTKRPTFKRAGEVRLSAGSFETYRVDADWTAPLADALAVRVVAFAEDAGSFRDTVHTKRHGASPSLAWRLGSSSQLVYELEFSHQEIPFDRGVLAVDGKLGLVPRNRFLGEPGDGPMQADVLGHQLTFQHDFGRDWSLQLGLTHRRTSLEGFSTEAELAVSRQTLYADGRTLSRQRRFRDYDALYQVLRAELNGRFRLGGLQHRLIVGADTDRFENDQVFLRARPPSATSVATPAQRQAIDIFEPVYGSYPLPAPGPLTDRVETQKSAGLFLQDQVELGAGVQLRFGARYDDYEQTLNNRSNGRVQTQATSRTSPQVGVVFRASQSVSMYAVYGENFRPLSGTDAAGQGFEPNQSRSFEAGAKFSLGGGAFDANVAAFRVEQENILVASDPSAATFVAAGKAASHGLELEISGELTSGLMVWGSYAWVDAKTRNAFNDANFGRLVPAGSRLLNVPEHTLSLQLVKRLSVGGRAMQLGTGVLHVGERSGEFTSDFKLPAYTVARAFVALDLTQAMTARLDVDNLFDTKYYTNSFSALWVQPGSPRSARASVNWRF